MRRLRWCRRRGERLRGPHRVTTSGRNSAPLYFVFCPALCAPVVQCAGRRAWAVCRVPVWAVGCAACYLMTSCVPRPEACSSGAPQPHFHTRRHNECLHKGCWAVCHWAPEQSQLTPRPPNRPPPQQCPPYIPAAQPAFIFYGGYPR